MPRGKTARRQRTARRQARSHRRDVRGVGKAPDATVEALVAGATSFKDFPLSERGRAWDGPAALQRWESECGIGGDSEDWARFHTGFFWYDGENAETVTAHHLLFVDVIGGTTTAVWRGVTTCAAAMQGSRGATLPEIPDADKATIKTNIGRYYDKAEKQYDDPSIEPPWESSEEEKREGEKSATSAPFALAYAEIGDVASPIELADRCLFWAEMLGEDVERWLVSSHAEALEAFPESHRDLIALDLSAREELGGKPSQGTPKDRRLKRNRSGEEEPEELGAAIADASADLPGAAALAEENELEAALAVVEEFASESGAETVLADAAIGVDPPAAVEAPVTPTRASLKRWTATFAPEGKPTEDGRIFAPGAITWRDTPLSLMAQLETQEGHDGAIVAGRIDRIYREGSLIRAEGVFDTGDYGQEIARMVGDGVLRGLSVDLAIREFEVAPRSQVLDADGNWIYDQPPPAAEEGEPEETSLLDILFGEDEDVLFVVTDGVIGTATVCAFPAFADAEIALTASAAVWRLRLQGAFTIIEEPVDEAVEQLEGLTASAAGLAPVAPPAAWFEMEEPEELTPLTVTDDGQVYGHAAAWGTCHIGFANVCTEPPYSPSEYAWFHLKEVVCDDGERISCGTITLDTNHAGIRLDATSATAHYDHTGTAVADVVAVDGELGIWVCGALRPDVDAAEARKLRGASVSGDWRGIDGARELIALLAVNVPGFPIPRPKALVASVDGEDPQVLAMVAAGLHQGPETLDRLAELELEKVKALAAADEFAELAAGLEEA